jgi:hypothetical protein
MSNFAPICIPFLPGSGVCYTDRFLRDISEQTYFGKNPFLSKESSHSVKTFNFGQSLSNDPDMMRLSTETVSPTNEAKLKLLLRLTAVEWKGLRRGKSERRLAIQRRAQCLVWVADPSTQQFVDAEPRGDGSHVKDATA